jgi:hypothetical protein
MEGAGDLEHRPDREMREGDVVEGPGWTLEAIETPGHTANHLSFRLAQENALFSGDHVMGWSTTIVAPPDGSMSEFHDLARETARPTGRGILARPWRRGARSAAIRARAHPPPPAARGVHPRPPHAGDRSTAEIVRAIYQGLSPALVRAAQLSVFAHLEDLVGQGKACTDGSPQVDGQYRPA